MMLRPERMLVKGSPGRGAARSSVWRRTRLHSGVMRSLVCATLLVSLVFGCGDDASDGTGGAGGAGGGEPEPVVTVLRPGGEPLPGESECKVTITEGLPNYGQTHVAVCTKVAYATNPPASGNHWPIWAAFGTYEQPVPREMLVHDLEHGAIVMSHRCQGDCLEVLDAFEEVVAAHGVDTICAAGVDPTVTSRFVITPDPELDAPIALSAWRATYVATCIDLPSLSAFVDAHYGEAPENVCAQGKDPSDPATGVPDCAP